MKAIVSGVTAAFMLCGGAVADTNVGGWEISPKSAKGICTAVRGYKDASDGDKENAVVLGVVKANNSEVFIVNLSYADWNFNKDESVKADLLIDDEPISKQTEWKGDKQGLTATFGQADDMISKFGNGKKVVLHFDSGDAVFYTPNAGLAIGAIQQCVAAD